MYKVTEVKGDITFYKDEKGKLYQKIQDNEIFPVRNGTMAYKFVQRIGSIEIKYNLNGVYGFCIFKRHHNLEDNIWSLERAIEIAKELNK